MYRVSQKKCCGVANPKVRHFYTPVRPETLAAKRPHEYSLLSNFDAFDFPTQERRGQAGVLQNILSLLHFSNRKIAS